MNVNISNALLGWGAGFIASEERSKVMEVQQGKNYYLAAFCQWGQVVSLGDICLKLNKAAFETPSLIIPRVVMAVQFLIYPIVAGVACSIKQGDYEWRVKKCNDLFQDRGIPLWLPENLSQETRAIFSFLVDHMGVIFEIATAISAVALIVLGDPYYGGAFLAVMTYGVLERNNYVARDISLFIETYSPIVSLAIIGFGGSGVSRCIALLMLTSQVPVGISQYLHKKIDLVARSCLGMKEYSLEEMESPWIENRGLSFREMADILTGDDGDYELNIAHCTKHVVDLSDMPVSENFDELLGLFDLVLWGDTKYYPLIRAKLLDDERFVCDLQERLPEERISVKNKDGKVLPITNTKMDFYLKKLAKKQGLSSKEQCAAWWQRNQMVRLVDVLMGRSRGEGSSKDLKDAIESLKKILPYLTDLHEKKAFVRLEDDLLKISIEGGGYCARGIKEMAAELLKDVIQSRSADPIKQGSPDVRYEYVLKIKLQELREQIIHKQYHKYEQSLVLGKMASDVHVFDEYKERLGFGFYPRTDDEKEGFNILDLCFWEVGFRYRHAISAEEYIDSLDSVIINGGQAEFYVHMKRILGGSGLSQKQYDAIFDPLVECAWSPEEALHRYARLLWVMMGVIRQKKI